MDNLFSIRYQDTELDVASGQRLTVEWMSVLFNEDNLFAGSHSYPILLPPTPRNKAALSNAHLPENRRARKRVPVLIQLFGQSWKRAMMAFDVVPDGFEGDLLIDNGMIAEWMRERSLASVFTISQNGKFVRHVAVKVASDGDRRAMAIQDSISNPGKYPWVFFPLRNEGRSGTADEATEAEAFINEWYEGGFNDTNGLYTPFFYLTWVIREVCTFLGFEARGSFLDHPEITKWVIYNTGMIGWDEFNSRTLELYPARHLPSMSVSEFFKALRNDRMVAIYFDSHTRIAHFELTDDVLARTDAVDLSAQVEAETIKIKRNEASGYSLRTRVDEGDEMYKKMPYARNYTLGTTETPKSQDLQTGTLFMWRGTMNTHAPHQARMPVAIQTGNIYDEAYWGTDAYNAEGTYGKNEFALRLLAYRGMVPFAPGVQIPYATSDHLDAEEQPAYDYSLQPGGDEGWLNRFCLNWFGMLCTTEQVDLTARLGVSEFMQLAPLRKLLYAGSSRARLQALPSRVTFEPTDQGRVVACRIVCYPHYNMAALEDSIRIGFTEGEIVIPEIVVYANIMVENARATVFTSREKRWIADVVLYFYQDEAGTIPYEVKGMPVYFIERYQNRGSSGVDREFNVEVRAEGSRHVVRSGFEISYWRKPTLWNLWSKVEVMRTYRLDISPDGSYVVLDGNWKFMTHGS